MPGDLDDRTDLQQADVTAIVNLGLIMSDDRTDLRQLALQHEES